VFAGRLARISFVFGLTPIAVVPGKRRTARPGMRDGRRERLSD